MMLTYIPGSNQIAWRSEDSVDVKTSHTITVVRLFLISNLTKKRQIFSTLQWIFLFQWTLQVEAMNLLWVPWQIIKTLFYLIQASAMELIGCLIQLLIFRFARIIIKWNLLHADFKMSKSSIQKLEPTYPFLILQIQLQYVLIINWIKGVEKVLQIRMDPSVLQNYVIFSSFFNS